MAQFYFLSVLFNILAGLVIVYGKKLVPETGVSSLDSISESGAESESDSDSESESESESEFDSEANSENADKKTKVGDFLTNFDSRSFRLVLGVLSMFVGLMKFLSVFRNDVPVIGDLLPAIAGLAGGAVLLIEYYSSVSSVGLEFPSWVTRIFVDSKRYVGIACLVAGLLHFICPQVMFL